MAIQELLLTVSLLAAPNYNPPSDKIEVTLKDFIGIGDIQNVYEWDRNIQLGETYIEFYGTIGAGEMYIVASLSENDHDDAYAGAPFIMDLNGTGLLNDDGDTYLYEFASGDYLWINSDTPIYILSKLDDEQVQSVFQQVTDSDDHSVYDMLIPRTMENVVNSYQSAFTNTVTIDELSAYWYEIGYKNGKDDQMIADDKYNIGAIMKTLLGSLTSILNLKVIGELSILNILLVPLSLSLLFGIIKLMKG